MIGWLADVWYALTEAVNTYRQARYFRARERSKQRVREHNLRTRTDHAPDKIR